MNATEFSALPDVQRMSATAVAYKALGEYARPVDGGSPFGGKLLLCAGLNERGYAYSLAMSIAGGTFLGIERRPQRLKEALRDGVCDYMVNNLDEALRVLKNEIRKKTPVSVGLLGEVASVLQEATERGVQPDFVVLGGAAADAKMFDALEQRGAVELTGGAVPAEPLLVVASAASPSTLRMFERAVAEVLKGRAVFGLRWAESSVRYFRRTTPPMRSALVDEAQVAAVEQGLRLQGLDGDLLLGIQDTDGSWRMENFAAA
jgi:hypothetical protein